MAVVALLLSSCNGIEGATEGSSTPPGGLVPYDALTEKLINDSWLGVQSSYPDAERPEVRLERYVTLDSAPAALDGCMELEGFPDVEVRADGALDSGPLPAAQRQAHAVSMWKCMAQYPYEPRFNQALTDDQIKNIYEYYTGDLTACLEAKGYSVSSPPSETTFVEGYYTAPKLWSPYDEIAVASDSNLADLYGGCPSLPGDLFG